MTTRKRYPEKYKEFQQFEAYRRNPYVENITGIGIIRGLKPKGNLIEAVTDDSGLKQWINDKDGRPFLAGKEYHGQDTLIDRRQYAKMYIEFIGLIIQKGIGLPAVRMLFFILKRLKIGSDVVQFTIAAAKAHTGYKADKSIYEGLVELIRMGVIARKEGSEEQYFINPQYIFRGKRDGLLNEPEDGAEVIG